MRVLVIKRCYIIRTELIPAHRTLQKPLYHSSKSNGRMRYGQYHVRRMMDDDVTEVSLIGQTCGPTSPTDFVALKPLKPDDPQDQYYCTANSVALAKRETAVHKFTMSFDTCFIVNIFAAQMLSKVRHHITLLSVNR